MSCPTCREVMPERTTVQTKGGPVQRRGFDIDHFERTWAQRVAEMKQRALDTGRVPTRKEILDAYNNLVRAQCPSCNRSHKFEGLPEQLLLLPGETQQAPPQSTGKNQ